MLGSFQRCILAAKTGPVSRGSRVRWGQQLVSKILSLLLILPEYRDCVSPSVPQLKTRAVSAKVMTMVEPIHLLLFGSSAVVSHGEGVVKLDDW